MKRSVCAIAVILLALLLTGCYHKDLSNAEKVEFVYTDFDYSVFDEGTQSYAIKKMYTVELNSRDQDTVTKIFSNLKATTEGNCGFGAIKILIHHEDDAYCFFPAGDHDNVIKINDDTYKQIDADDLEILHAIIGENVPTEMPESFKDAWID